MPAPSRPVPWVVGFWGGEASSRHFPLPQWLVRPGWRLDERDRIAAYLKSGKACLVCCGRARCRFDGCGIVLGSADLTDGRWLWPAKLEHYILEHDVCLPDEFVDDMRAAGWQVPADLDGDAVGLQMEIAGRNWEPTFWRAWGERMRPA